MKMAYSSVAYNRMGMDYGKYNEGMDTPGKGLDLMLIGVIAAGVVLGIVSGIVLGRRSVKKRQI